MRFLNKICFYVCCLWNCANAALSMLVVFCYRMVGSRENRQLLLQRVAHKAERILTKITFFVKTWRKSKRSSKLNNENLGTFFIDLISRIENWWEERCKYMEPYIDFEEWLIANIFGRNIVNVKYTGSHRESIVSMHYSETSSDIDMMYIYKDLRIGERKANHKHHFTIANSNNPGYVLLKINCSKNEILNEYQKIATQGDFDPSLQIEKLLDYFSHQVLYETPSNVKYDKKITGNKIEAGSYYIRSDNFRKMHEDFNRGRFLGWMKFQQHGPASRISWNVAGLPQRQMIGDIDIVFCLHCDDWPQQVTEWISRIRHHGYPPKDVMSEIISYGVDLVPKGSKLHEKSSNLKLFINFQEKYDPFEWRLSFSVGELLLVKAWNKAQKSFYRFVKTLRNDYLSKYEVSSYALKNIMLYVIEETPEELWTAKNFVELSKRFFAKLYTCCERKTCSHYFVPEMNLFHDMSNENLMSSMAICNMFIDDLYSTVLLSDGLWFKIKEFEYLTYWRDLERDDEEKISRHHLRETNDRIEEVKRYKATVRTYYCHKVHRECMKFLLKSLNRTDISPDLILKVLIGYIEHKVLKHDGDDFKSECREFHKNSTLKMEEKTIFYHVVWATIKCLRRLNDVDINYPGKNKRDQLIGCLFGIIMTDTSCQPIVAVELFTSKRYIECVIKLNQITIQSGIDEFFSTALTPLIFCSLDAAITNEISEFKYDDSAYYCPLVFFKVFVTLFLSNNKENGQQVIDLVQPTKSELLVLLETGATLWKKFPIKITARVYQVVFMSFSKHIYNKMRKQILEL